MITHLPSHCKFQKMWQKLAGPASYNLASLTWEKRLWLQGEKDTPKWERPAIIMIIIIISKAETNQTVHRSLWSSPGSFLRSPLPLSKRRHELEFEKFGFMTLKPNFSNQSQKLTCVFPLPVCPYAKHVAIPLSKMVSTSGWAVNLQGGVFIGSRIFDSSATAWRKKKKVYL